MSGSQRLPVERTDSFYKDSDLLSSTTDCVELNGEAEQQVTEAIKALLDILKGRVASSGTFTTPTCQTVDSVMAMEYFADFSYGLTPGEARYVVYRYLKSSGMNIRKAVERMARSAEWRKKQNMNKMALFPCIIPMRGFEQRTMCEELRLPFMSHTSFSKRRLDAEGRLRLEHESIEYGDTPRRRLYADLTGTTVSDQSTRLDLNHSGCLSTQQSVRVSRAASSSTPAAGPANEQTLEADESVRIDRDVESARASSSKERQHKCDDKKGGGALLRSLWSLLPLFRFESGRCSPHVLASQHASVSTVTSEARRHSRFHSILSVGSCSERAKSDAEADELETHDMEEVADFLSTAGAARAVMATLNARYADCLNFHGILQPIAAVITKHVPFSFHYWDLMGHPIMYCRLGGLHSKCLMEELFALTPIDAEPRVLVMLFNTYALLVLEQLIRYCNRRSRESAGIFHDLLPSTPCMNRQRKGCESPAPTRSPSSFQRCSLLGSFVIVVDCAGVKFRRYLYKPLLVLVRAIVQMNMHHYPELLHHLYVTNCTTVVSWSYLMLRGMLTKATREKVTFCSKFNTVSTLCNNISSALVPQELGGNCHCPGGCIPSMATMLDTHSTTANRSPGDAHSSITTPLGDGDSDSHTEQVAQQFGEEGLAFNRLRCTAQRLVLKARESRKLSFAMNAQSEIVWEFAVKHERYVTFSAVFVSAANDGAMLLVVPRRRVQNEAGHYICPSMGTVIFEWSNKRSFFTCCRLSVKVYHEECSSTSV
ncbi:hypothetical protein LSCM1_01772 [Leishmania martiniquensis]|uniref:CRAL-TRIO domain-containing protein n=1 Tax=Leishmania martiniquensis TaxID=1580590 RepID=A0A836KLW9_9TRYP|nr:hypothetical protein LSCM1_01772 [Leishmania martiniquensis]